ncbi:MAG: hypothetical protein ACP5JU_03365 [Minisyncoccia bacterium]
MTTSDDYLDEIYSRLEKIRSLIKRMEGFVSEDNLKKLNEESENLEWNVDELLRTINEYNEYVNGPADRSED